MFAARRLTSLSTMRMPRSLALLGASACVAMACTSEPDGVVHDDRAENESAATSPATVTVNAAVESGLLATPQRQNNWTGPNFQRDFRPADVDFLDRQGLHAGVYRVWAGDNAIYSPTSKTYDYTDMIPYLTDLSKVADKLLVNIGGSGFVVAWKYTPAQSKPIIKNIIRTLKQKFPKVTYIEALNEPNLVPHYPASFDAKQDYSYYKVFYEVVNELNDELGLSGEDRLEIGGPVLANFDTDWIAKFLDAFKADTSSKKRLDFISYHNYKFRDYPGDVGGQRAKIDALLGARGLSKNIPTFISEVGLYPGEPGTDVGEDGTPKQDSVIQAAGMASLLYSYGDDPRNVPFNWVGRHSTNERKDQLVTRPTAISGALTAYGNLLKSMSMMKKARIDAVSSVDSRGRNLNVRASQDNSGISLLAWNYQYLGTQNYDMSAKFVNLPQSFREHPIRVRRYLIDDGHSNHYGGRPELAKVGETFLGASSSATINEWASANAVQLFMLEPDGSSRATIFEDHFDQQAINSNPPGWSVTERSGTYVHVAEAPNSAGRSLAILDSSTSEYGAATRTFTDESSKVVAEWRFEDTTNLSYDKFQLRLGSTVAAEVLVDDSKDLVANGRSVFKTPRTSTWYTVKVVADPSMQTYDVFVNGELGAGNIPFLTPVQHLDNFYVRTSENAANKLYLAYVTVEAENQIVSSFENDALGSAPKAWALAAGGGTVIAVHTTKTDANGKSAELDDNSTTNLAEIKRDFSTLTGKVTLEMKINEAREFGYEKFRLLSGSTVGLELYLDTDGNLRSGASVLKKLAKNTQYTVRVVADVTAEFFDIYVDGTRVGRSIPFQNDVANIDAIAIRTGETARNDLFVDIVKIYENLR